LGLELPVTLLSEADEIIECESASLKFGLDQTIVPRSGPNFCFELGGAQESRPWPPVARVHRIARQHILRISTNALAAFRHKTKIYDFNFHVASLSAAS
jgi:hypothetical protein